MSIVSSDWRASGSCDASSPLHGIVVVVRSGTGDGRNGPAATPRYDLTFRKTDSTISGVSASRLLSNGCRLAE